LKSATFIADATVANSDGHWVLRLTQFSAGDSYLFKIESNTDKIESFDGFSVMDWIFGKVPFQNR